MSLELIGPAVLKHVNPRKEGPGAEKVLMVDLKLWATTDSGVLAYFDPTLSHFLFNETGARRIKAMKPIGLTGAIEHMELGIQLGRTFVGVKLHKFVIAPLDGWKVALSWTATFAPLKTDVAILAELLGEQVDLELKSERDLLTDQTIKHRAQLQKHEEAAKESGDVVEKLLEKARADGVELSSADGRSITITPRHERGATADKSDGKAKTQTAKKPAGKRSKTK